MSRRVDQLLDWCNDHGIELFGIRTIDTSTEPTTDNSGISVVADRDLSYSDLVAKIPKTSILSKRTSRLLSNGSDIETQTNDVLELSLILAYELALGERSEWFGYLQSLPPEQVPIAALWEGNDDQDSQLAARWLQGTETNHAVQHLSKNLSLSETISDYYYRVACPTLARVGCAATLCDFRLALSLVSSRSFRVDSYHGLAMVPIADAFNHTGENQVHIETDFDVCPSCGSLQSCPHDDENDAAPSEEGTLSLENTCDMVMNAPVSAGDEVFNSYDSNLPNSVLLARYGFILEGNESDYVSWANTRLPPVMQGCIRALSEGLDEIWTEELLNKSSLVYDSRDPLAVTSVYDPTARSRSSTREPHFRINSDGLVSVDLWTVAAVCAVKAVRDDPLGSIIRASLSQLARAQVYAESDAEYCADGYQKDTGIPSNAWLELKILANLVQDLCRSRLEDMHRPELSVAECGDLLDSLPEGMVRSRMAVAQALSERATLVTCKDAWSDLVAAIDDTDPELN